LQQRLQLLRRIDAVLHQFRRPCRGVRRTCRHAYQAGACAQRGESSQTHRAGHSEVAAHHQHVAERTFVRAQQLRAIRLVQRRTTAHALNVAVHAVHHLGGHIKIGERHTPGVFRPTTSEQTTLEANKRHGQVGANTGTHHRAGIAGDPGRHVDRQRGCRTVVNPRNQRRSRTTQVALQAGSEQSVDQQIVAVQGCFIGRPGAPADLFPCITCRRGVAADALRVTVQENLRLSARLVQQAGHHEAVTAVVAGTADDRDPVSAGPA
jgi:hypothetical protein